MSNDETVLTESPAMVYATWEQDDFTILEIPGTIPLEQRQAELLRPLVAALAQWIQQEIEAGYLVVVEGEVRLANEPV